MKLNITFFLMIIVLYSSCSDDKVSYTDTNNTPAEWTVNLGRDTTIPFFPDGQSNYFTYTFERAIEDTSIIQLKGQFPNTRYMSIIVYNNDTRDPIGIIRDTEITPLENNLNPFQEQEYIEDQIFEISIGPNINNQQTFNNKINFNSNITSVSIFIRYYVPAINDLGGVALPQITAITSNGTPILAPEPKELEDLIDIEDIENNLIALANLLFPNEPEADRHFFRANGNSSRNFANPDNEYLISALNLEDEEVVILRWRAPSVSQNFDDFASKDMRYYSMSLSDKNSYNFRTLYDQELYIAKDGFINLVITKNDIEIINHSAGLNIQVWPEELDEQAYLLYRNMLTKPGLNHGIYQCETISGNANDFFISPESFNALNFIGDYAPTGLKMSKAEFLSNFGDIQVSY